MLCKPQLTFDILCLCLPEDILSFGSQIENRKYIFFLECIIKCQDVKHQSTVQTYINK